MIPFTFLLTIFFSHCYNVVKERMLKNMKKNYLFHLLLSITICWFAFQRYDKYIDNLTASLPTVDGKRYTIAS